MGRELALRVLGPDYPRSKAWEAFYAALTPEERRLYDASHGGLSPTSETLPAATTTSDSQYASPPAGVSESTWAQYQNLRRSVGEPGAPQRPIITRQPGVPIGQERALPPVMDVGLTIVETPPPGSPFKADQGATGPVELPTVFRTQAERGAMQKARAEFLANAPGWESSVQRDPLTGKPFVATAAPSGDMLTGAERSASIVLAAGAVKAAQIAVPVVAKMIEAHDALADGPRELWTQAIENVQAGKPGAVATASLALPLAVGGVVADIASRPIQAGLRAAFDFALMPQSTLFGVAALVREGITGKSVRGEHSVAGAILDPTLGAVQNFVHTFVPDYLTGLVGIHVPAYMKGRISARDWLFGIDPKSAGTSIPDTRGELAKRVLSLVAEATLDPAYVMTLGASGAVKIAGHAGEVALTKVAGREVSAAARELIAGTLDVSHLAEFGAEAQNAIRPILVSRAERGAALLAAGFSESAIEQRVGPLFSQHLQDVLVNAAKTHIDNVRFTRRIALSNGGEVWRGLNPVTKAKIELTPFQHEISSEFVKRNIDLGGIGIMLPHHVEATRLIEWQRHTVVDARKWWDLAQQLEPIRVADMAGSAVYYKLTSPFSTFYNKYGRVPTALYRQNSIRQGRGVFLQDTYRKQFEDIIRANNLNGNQAELLMSLLDLGKSATDPTLEIVRRRVLEDPGLKLAWEQGIPLREFVRFVGEDAHIDEASGFAVAAALRTGRHLDDPLLENVRQKAEPVFAQMMQDARLYGADLNELVGGNYIPHRPARRNLMEVMRDSWDAARTKDRQAGIEVLADAGGSSGTGVRRATAGGQQKAQRHRTLYLWRGVDGDAFLATPEVLAAKPTNVERVQRSVTAVQRQKVAMLDRHLDTVERHIDALKEVTVGRSPAEVAGELQQKRAELESVERQFVDPAQMAERELATLQRRRAALDHRVGVLQLVQNMSAGGGAQDPFFVHWNQTAGAARQVEQDLLTLGLPDEVVAPLVGAIREHAYLRLDQMDEARRMVAVGETATAPRFVQMQRDAVDRLTETMANVKQSILTTTASDEAANRGLQVANRELTRLLDQKKALDKLDALDTKIGMTENRLRVLDPSGARDLRERTMAELAELRKAQTAARKEAGEQTTRRQLQNQIMQQQNDIANRLDALMAQIPTQSDALFVARQRKYRRAAGPFQVGDEVIVASGSHEPSTVIGHLTEEPNGTLRQLDLTNMPEGKFAPSLDESTLHYVVQNPNGTVRHYKKSSLTNPPDYGNLVFYNREKAYLDEINDTFPGMFDPSFAAPVAQRAVEHAKMISNAEFYNNLKELGWARAQNPGNWVEAEFVPQLKGYYVSKNTREFLLDTWKSEQPLHGPMRALQSFNGWWKGTVTSIYPAFNGQNAFSNVWLNFMDTGLEALNPVGLATAIQLNVWHHKALGLERESMAPGKVGADAQSALIALLDRPVLTDLSGKEWRFGEFRDAQRLNRVAFTGRNMGMLDLDIMTNRELDRLAAREWGQGPAAKVGSAVGTAVGLPGQYGRTAANFIEDVFRTQNFLVNLRKNGGDVVNAAERANQFFFDYQSLTATERNILRQLLPFYTFSKKNLVLQAQMALKRPGQLAFQAHLVNAVQMALGEEPLSQEEMTNLPPYVQRGAGLVVNRKDFGLGIFSNIGLPLQAALNAATPYMGMAKEFPENFPPKSGGLGVGSMAWPIKTAAELATGYYLWLDRSMGSKVRIDAMGTFIDHGTPKPLKDTLMRYLQMDRVEEGPGNIAYYAHNVKGAYLLQNMPPFSRIWSEMSKMSARDIPLGPRVLEMLLGFNYRQLTQGELQGYEAAALRALRRESGIRERTEDAILETSGAWGSRDPSTPSR